MADLGAIPLGHVITCTVELGGKSIPKLFLLVAQTGNEAHCLTITSNLAVYQNNPVRAAGAVVCAAGEHPFFKSPSIIEPDNGFDLPHRRWGAPFLANDQGAISDALLTRLKAAVERSQTLSPHDKARLMSRLAAIKL